MTNDELQVLTALGMTFVPDFMTAAEEAELLPNILYKKRKQNIDQHDGRNCVQRYGSKVPYNNHMVSAEIPEHFAKFSRRLVERNLLTVLPDSVTVNEYLTGQVIRAHVDALGAGPVITVLSVGSPAEMVFRRQEACYTMLLTPRSLIQLRGDLRYKWTHEIKPVAATRYSVVFRNSQECEPSP